MSSLVEVLNDAAPAIHLSTLGLLGLKLTLVALAGHLALALAGRASAARRHLVATATLGVLVALPIAAALAPSWKLAILPSPRADAPSSFSPSVADARDSRFGSTPPALRSDERRVAAAPRETSPVQAAGSFVRASRPSAPRASRSALLATVLLVVSLVLGSWLLLTIAAAAWFAARSIPVTDPILLAEMERARKRMNVLGTVRLKSRCGLRVPMVAGLFRPTLVIPEEAVAWPLERVRAVLLHELAHVRRHDAWSMLLARVATTVLWFHPLVWMLARTVRRDCERACDDLALETGMRPSEYAEHLLWVARAATGATPASFAMAFARPTSLEGRLLSILRSDVRRAANSRRSLAAAAAIAVLALAPVASVRVVAAPARALEGAEPRHERAVPRVSTDAPVASEYAGTLEASDEAGMRDGDRDAGSDSEPAATEIEPGSVASNAATPPDIPLELESAPEIVLAGYSTRADRSEERDGDDWFGRARGLYDERRYAQAGEAYLRAARAGYRRGTSLYNAGCSFALAHQNEEALDALEEAIAEGFDGSHMLASDDDLDALREERRFEELVVAARRTDAGERKRRSAVSAYDAARAAGSNDEGAWGTAGVTLLRSGEYSRAARAFERQIAIEPSSHAHYNLACAFGLEGDEDRGIASLEQAVLAGHSDPGHMRSDPDLRPLRKHERFESIVELADELQLFVKGRENNDRSSWRAAVADFERTARRHPNIGRAWFNLGFARLKAKDPSGSYEAFERALQLEYRVKTTSYNLACASAQMREAETALQWLDRAQAEGLDVGGIAHGDSDLDPLRSDPEFRRRLARWNREHDRKDHSGKD